ncbi:MAG: hypothetical protein J7578_08850 [Chitinophagaceae bacterium]|nr:hypothetical protein [Chitinophagaceae bacterium]
MKPLFLFFFLITSFSLAAQQQYIGLTTGQVKRHMRSYIKFYKYTMFTMEEKKNEISYLLREDKVQHTDFKYEFDPKGKCIASGVYGNCLQCIERDLNLVLKKDRYGWVKINDSTWLSSYRRSLQMTMKKNVGEGFMYGLDIRKMIWSRTWYNDRIAGKI